MIHLHTSKKITEDLTKSGCDLTYVENGVDWHWSAHRIVDDGPQSNLFFRCFRQTPNTVMHQGIKLADKTNVVNLADFSKDRENA
ncbi:MAG: hypothetical protein C0620_07755 [Desulfuromonas sp.]|nr:MAG: hypothetical protein C0620_07755 [Desulfuromonas sp.]